MMRSTIGIGSLFGIPISLSPSWFLTLALILAFLCVQVYPSAFPDESPVLHWSLALACSVLFFISIIAHELAHALVARAHRVPVRGIRLFAFGGVAQIGNDPRSARADLLMALAGPMASLLLGLAFLGIAAGFGVETSIVNEAIRSTGIGLSQWIGDQQPVGRLWQFLGFMNILLSVFNLLPAFPMDGGRVLRAILWAVTKNYYRSTRLAARGGQLAGYSLIAFGVLAMISKDQMPILSDYSSLRIGPVGGVWLIFLGLFVSSAARQSWSQIRILEALRNFRVADVMNENIPTIGRATRIQVLDDGLGNRRERLCFFVVDEDETVIGMLTDQQVIAVPKSRRPTTTAGEAMRAVGEVATADPQEDAATVLQRIEVEDVTHMPVVDDGRLVGVVARDAFLRLLVRERSLPADQKAR